MIRLFLFPSLCLGWSCLAQRDLRQFRNRCVVLFVQLLDHRRSVRTRAHIHVLVARVVGRLAREVKSAIAPRPSRFSHSNCCCPGRLPLPPSSCCAFSSRDRSQLRWQPRVPAWPGQDRRHHGLRKRAVPAQLGNLPGQETYKRTCMHAPIAVASVWLFVHTLFSFFCMLSLCRFVLCSSSSPLFSSIRPTTRRRCARR